MLCMGCRWSEVQILSPRPIIYRYYFRLADLFHCVSMVSLPKIMAWHSDYPEHNPPSFLLVHARQVPVRSPCHAFSWHRWRHSRKDKLVNAYGLRSASWQGNSHCLRGAPTHCASGGMVNWRRKMGHTRRQKIIVEWAALHVVQNGNVTWRSE